MNKSKELTEILTEPIISCLQSQQQMNHTSLNMIQSYTTNDVFDITTYKMNAGDKIYDMCIPTLTLTHIPSLSINRFKVNMNVNKDTSGMNNLYVLTNNGNKSTYHIEIEICKNETPNYGLNKLNSMLLDSIKLEQHCV